MVGLLTAVVRVMEAVTVSYVVGHLVAVTTKLPFQLECRQKKARSRVWNERKVEKNPAYL